MNTTRLNNPAQTGNAGNAGNAAEDSRNPDNLKKAAAMGGAAIAGGGVAIAAEKLYEKLTEENSDETENKEGNEANNHSTAHNHHPQQQAEQPAQQEVVDPNTITIDPNEVQVVDPANGADVARTEPGPITIEDHPGGQPEGPQMALVEVEPIDVEVVTSELIAGTEPVEVIDLPDPQPDPNPGFLEPDPFDTHEDILADTDHGIDVLDDMLDA